MTVGLSDEPGGWAGIWVRLLRKFWPVSLLNLVFGLGGGPGGWDWGWPAATLLAWAWALGTGDWVAEYWPGFLFELGFRLGVPDLGVHNKDPTT